VRSTVEHDTIAVCPPRTSRRSSPSAASPKTTGRCGETCGFVPSLTPLARSDRPSDTGQGLATVRNGGEVVWLTSPSTSLRSGTARRYRSTNSRPVVASSVAPPALPITPYIVSRSPVPLVPDGYFSAIHLGLGAPDLRAGDRFGVLSRCRCLTHRPAPQATPIARCAAGSRCTPADRGRSRQVAGASRHTSAGCGIPGTVTRAPPASGGNPALPEVGSSPVSWHEGCSAR
jgi:hypothetical protein